MTTIRLIKLLFIFSCLLLPSCNFPDSQQTKRTTTNSNSALPARKSTSSQTASASSPIDWPGAKDAVDKAGAKFNIKNKESTLPPTVKQVLDETNKALAKLGKDEGNVDIVCGSCGEDAQTKTRHAWILLSGVTKKLKDKDAQRLVDLDPAFAFQIKGDLDEASNDLKGANDSYVAFSTSDRGSNGNNNSSYSEDGARASSGSLDLIWPIAGAVAGLGLIVLAVFGVMRFKAGFWAKLDGHVNDIVQAHIGGVKRRHDELGKHLAELGEEQRKASSRLESIGGEVQALGRRLRQGALDDVAHQEPSGRQAFDEYAKQAAKPIEPEFPASAGEYLNRMKRNSIIVKPDFQNGILVNDVDGKGELVLVRDSNIPDDAQPLFIVPRVTQFQTKQEFYAYYEKYYDCQKPSSGEVWIIDPAVVSTVAGGWQLREKGVLEVR